MLLGARSLIPIGIMMTKLPLEVGPKYKMTYHSGDSVCFQIIGGEPIKIHVFEENEDIIKKTIDIQSISLLENINSIEKIND